MEAAANRPSVFCPCCCSVKSVTHMGVSKGLDALETLDIGQEKKKTKSKGKRAGGYEKFVGRGWDELEN